MFKLPRAFWWMLLAAIVVRLIAAALAPMPGIGDPTHYYNLARNVAEGRGFVIDYIWQYHNPPLDITHPEDYWMPLPAVWPAISFMIFGQSLFAALLPSVIFGALLSVLAYAIAALARAEIPVRLMAMVGIIFLPELVLNSARTDTTISYILFFGLTALYFYSGLRQNPKHLFLSGLFAGLTQLSRQDGIILAPAMLVSLLIFARYDDKPPPYRWLVSIVVGWLLALLPWMLRNHALFGVLLTGGAGRTLFMTSFIDQFTYGRELNLQHYLDWGLPNILTQYVFMALANIKTVYTLPDVLLPVIAPIGIASMLWKRDKERLLLLTLPLMMVVGLFLFYSFVTPFHTQGGSFHKSYMLILPFLAFAGAWALHEFVRPTRLAYAFAGIMALLMLLNSFDLVRLDFDLARRFNNSMITLTKTLESLGDSNEDGEIVLMTQDPFILNYHGFRAIIAPSDPRDMIVKAAYRYRADYVLLPAARPALDTLLDGTESDQRIVFASTVPDSNWSLFRFVAED